MLLIDSLLGLPLQILPEDGAYYAITVAGRDSEGMTVNFFAQPSESLKFSALLNGSPILEAARFGPILYHGIEFLGVYGVIFTGIRGEEVDVDGKVAIIMLGSDVNETDAYSFLAYKAQISGALCIIISMPLIPELEGIPTIYENSNVDAIDIPVFFTTEKNQPSLKMDIVVIAKDLMEKKSSKERIVFNSLPIANLNAIPSPRRFRSSLDFYAHDFRKKSGFGRKICKIKDTCTS